MKQFSLEKYTSSCTDSLYTEYSDFICSRRSFLKDTLITSSVLYTLSGCAQHPFDLEQWYHTYSEPGVIQAVKKYASTYTAQRVKVGWIAGDYARKSNIALLSDKAPDVLELEGGPSIDKITNNQIIPLNDVVRSAAKDFSFDLINSVTYKGEIYGIPQAIDSVMLFYRKSLLEKLGIAPPETLSELISAAKKLTCDDYKGLFLGNSGGTQIATLLVASTGKKIIENTTTTITTAEVIEAFSRLRELITSNSLLIGAPTEWSNPAAIITGLCAMQICGSWAIPQLEKVIKDDIGTIPWPILAPNIGTPIISINAYFSTIPAQSRHHDAAKSYVQWLWIDRTDYQLNFSQDYGLHIPARTSLISQANKWQNTKLSQDALKNITRYGKLVTPQLLTPIGNQAISDALSRIMREGKNAHKELHSAANIIDQEIDRITR